MDTIGNMRSLVAVARAGSFSAAARELSLSTAMVSKHIKQPEEHLGVQLMRRSTRGVSLTDPGQVYCDHAMAILVQIEEAENAVSTMNANPIGSLRISCPPSFGTHVLTPMLSDYIQHNPAVNVELGLQDDEPDVVGARLDLIIRLGDLKDSSLIARKLGDARFALCGPRTAGADGGRRSVLDELPNRHGRAGQQSVALRTRRRATRAPGRR